MQTTILSLGGSLIIPDTLATPFLHDFKQLILETISPTHRVVIITGGGSIARTYQHAAKELGSTSAADLDWVGILASRLNAELVRSMFGSLAHSKVVYNPTEPLKTHKQIIIGAGFEPGCSTDTDAVLLAHHLGAQTVVNLTNIDYVYDHDPRTHPDAKPFSEMRWGALRALVGGTWSPGLNMPFDPI